MLTVQYLERSLLLLVIVSSGLPLRTIKSCSVLFGVTLSLEAFCHKHFIVVFREQQTKPLTNVQCH